MNSYRPKLDELILQHKQAAATLTTEKSALEKCAEKAATIAAALTISQQLAAQLQRRAQQKISTIVTRCLQFVFDDPYEFEILFETKRGKTEAKMIFRRDSQEFDPLTSTGGGVVDVAAFGLRLAALVLSRPVRRRLLVMDEPFRFVSRNYRGRVRELLLALAREYGVQLILVTHFDDLRIGEVVELS